MKLLSEEELDSVNGGVNYMNMKISRLKNEFERACRQRRMDRIMPILTELQARGEFAWAKEMANSYGITSF